MPAALDLTGQRFGNLTAIKKLPSKNKNTYWLCKCDCGNKEEIQTGHLTTGIKKCCRQCAHLSMKLLNNNNTSNHRSNFKPREQKCPLCGKIFINKHNSRHYCYDCIPESAPPDKRQFYKQRAFKHFLVEHKGGRCELCGYDKCEAALEFHHKNPEEKDLEISKWNFNYNQNIEDYIKEIDKCMLLCANCHREQHYNWNILPPNTNNEAK